MSKKTHEIVIRSNNVTIHKSVFAEVEQLCASFQAKGINVTISGFSVDYSNVGTPEPNEADAVFGDYAGDDAE